MSEIPNITTSRKKINLFFVGLFIFNGTIIVGLTIFGLISSILWLLLGGSLLILGIISVFLTEKSNVSLYVIILLQLFLRLPFLLRDYFFVFETDEMYHFGLALRYAFFPLEMPIERMEGYVVYSLMDTITARVLLIFGSNFTMIFLKLIYGLLFPVILVILVDFIFKKMDCKYSFRVSTLLFTSCYRFLFFFSLYIFETGTFLLFVALIAIVFRFMEEDKTDFYYYIHGFVLLVISFFMSVWHYNGVFLGSLVLIIFFFLSRYVVKDRVCDWKIGAQRFFMGSFLLLNWYASSSLYAGKMSFSIYYQVLIDVFPFLNTLDYNFIYLIIFEILLFLIVGLSFLLFSRIYVLFQSNYVRYLERFGKKIVTYSGMIPIIFISIIELLIFLVSIFFYNFYKSTEGFRTIGDYGLFTVLTLNGLIIFFILSLISVRWVLNEKQRIFYFLFFLFFILTLVTFIFPPRSNPTFPYRMITYVFLFGTPLAIFSLSQLMKYITKSTILDGINIKRLIFPIRLRNFSYAGTFILLIVMMSQSVTLARWESYTASYSLPTEDILTMSDWMRENISPNNSRTFIEYIYIPISAYSYIDRARTNEVEILISLYYQRNITRVIEIFREQNITYSIFDLACLNPRFMTKIGREHILMSYGVPSSSFKNFNGTIPNEFEIAFRTENLVLLKTPSYNDSQRNLIAHWDMDEGSGIVAYDQTQNGHNAFLTVSPNWTKGISGNALDFDSKDEEFVSVFDHNDFSFTGESPFSFSFWMRAEGLSTMGIVTKTTSNSYEWAVLVMNDGKIRFLCMTDPINYIAMDSSSVISSNLWYHIATTYNGNGTYSGFKIFIDGVDRSNSGIEEGIYLGMSNTAANVNIGRYNDSNFFNGKLDEIRIYSKELNSSEIQNIINLDSFDSRLTGLKLGEFSNQSEIFLLSGKSFHEVQKECLYRCEEETKGYWDIGYWVNNELNRISPKYGILQQRKNN